MNTTEVVQFGCIIALMAASYWWFWTWGDREQRNSLVKMQSATYPVAQTGSMFVPSFEPYVQKSGTIFLPVTDGLYATRVTPKKGRNYREGLRKWLARGATIEVFVTHPDEEHPDEHCLREWGPLLRDYSDRLHVHLLFREQAKDNATKSQIERLDTFHPVILVDTSDAVRPGVMWIEDHHPVGSKYAYDVTFLNPADTATDGRLPIYQHMYEGLLNGSHVRPLKPTKH